MARFQRQAWALVELARYHQFDRIDQEVGEDRKLYKNLKNS